MQLPYPTHLIRSVIRSHTATYEITRVTYGVGDRGQSTETESTHNADLWLFNPREGSARDDFGIRVEGQLGGLAIPEDVDIERQDQLSHGDDTYRVESLTFQPNHENKEVLVLSLERMDNP